ncbi:hypothetical protein [Nocardia aurea]|uniref:hypothetical protein n=1 Tax=Nocardia aurea TaxID=2144174 RepID=UPI0033AB4CAE
MSKPICFLDTETTGLHLDRRPWEIAMIRRDEDGQRSITLQVEDVDLSNAELIGLNIGKFYDRHVCFNGLGPDAVAELRTGRTQQLVLATEAEAACAVELWTRGAHIVGAVPNFDTECLAAMLRRHNLCPSWHYHLIDVEAMMVGWLRAGGATNVLPHVVRETLTLPWKSGDLSRAIGILPPSEELRHTAMGDADWAMRIFDRIVGGDA